MDDKSQNQKKIKDSQVNQALGIFILFFGIIIVFATVYTETLVGQMTNLIAGVVLSGIGLGMWLKARSNIKKFNLKD